MVEADIGAHVARGTIRLSRSHCKRVAVAAQGHVVSIQPNLTYQVIVGQLYPAITGPRVDARHTFTRVFAERSHREYISVRAHIDITCIGVQRRAKNVSAFLYPLVWAQRIVGEDPHVARVNGIVVASPLPNCNRITIEAQGYIRVGAASARALSVAIEIGNEVGVLVPS